MMPFLSSCFGGRDPSCMLALCAFLLAHFLQMVAVLKEDLWWEDRTSLWYDLDPLILQERWSIYLELRFVRTVTGLVNMAAWFLFLFVISQLSWELSDGMNRKFGLHLWMNVLVFAGFFTECVSRLMTMGMENIVDWVSRQFNIKDWGASKSGRDDLGWKVVELLHTVNNGIIMWVEVFEWLAIGVIMFLVFVSISTESVSVFPRPFATLSSLLSVVSVLTFALNVFRLDAHQVFAPLQLTFLSLNLILYPLWFWTLSGVLPRARRAPRVNPKRFFYAG